MIVPGLVLHLMTDQRRMDDVKQSKDMSDFKVDLTANEVFFFFFYQKHNNIVVLL